MSAGTRPAPGSRSGSPMPVIRRSAGSACSMSIRRPASSSGPRRAEGRHRAPRLLDRERAPRLGDTARPGWRGQPRPDRRLDRRNRRRRRKRPGRGRRSRPLGPARRHGCDRLAPGAGTRRAPSQGRARCTCNVPRHPAYGLPSRATLKVGRRVGAHRGPRPGRASGSCGFTGTHPDRTHPGRRVPAAHHPRGRSDDRRSRSDRSTTAHRLGRRRSTRTRRSSNRARRRTAVPTGRAAFDQPRRRAPGPARRPRGQIRSRATR